MIHRFKLAMILSLILLAMFVILTGSPLSADARTIGVVYDDSGSMAGGGNNGKPPYDHRFAYASYSLQTLRALLSNDDKLIVGFMNDSTYVSTNDTKRDISVLETRSHPKNPTGQKKANTPYSSVTQVMRLLQQEKAVGDRWLVIISDGQFEPDRIPADLNEHITGFQQRVPGVKVICLGIASGSTNRVFDAWREHAGASILTTPASQIISDKMQQIAAMVTANTTGSGILPDVHGDQLTFTPPFPIRRFTILQQSSSPEDLAEVKKVTSAKGKTRLGVVSRTATPAVDTSKGSFSAVYGSILQVNPVDRGVVIPADSPISITLSKTVSRKTSIVFLPEVSVNLRVSLYDDKGAEIQHDGSRIFSSCPDRSAKIKAVLDFGAGYGNAKAVAAVRVTFHYGSETTTLKWNPKEGAFTGEIMVSEGTRPIRTSAEYEGYLNILDTGMLRSIGNCAPRAIAVRVQRNGSDIQEWDADVRFLDQKDLAPLIILPQINGDPISREELNNYRCTVEGPYRLPFQVTPLPTGQGWELRPRKLWCNSCITATGDFPLLLTFDGKGNSGNVTASEKAVRVAIRSNGKSINAKDTVTTPKEIAIRIKDPGLLHRCWLLIAALLGLVAFAVWLIGIIKKPRFARGSVIEYLRSGQYARKQTESLAGSWTKRWLIPFVPESREIEGVTFKAGNRNDYVLVAKQCQSEQMLVAGSKIDAPGSSDAWLNDKEMVEIKGTNRTETYRYLA